MSSCCATDVRSARASKSGFGHFEGKPEVVLLSEGRHPWLVRFSRPFTYVDPGGRHWTVQKGFESDGASIPRWAWGVIGGPLDGVYRDAAFIHDAACQERSQPWWEVHRIFYFAMRARDVPSLQAKVMYAAVRRFGPRWTVPDRGAPVGMQHLEAFIRPDLPDRALDEPAFPAIDRASFTRLASLIEQREGSRNPMSLDEIDAFESHIEPCEVAP